MCLNEWLRFLFRSVISPIKGPDVFIKLGGSCELSCSERTWRQINVLNHYSSPAWSGAGYWLRIFLPYFSKHTWENLHSWTPSSHPKAFLWSARRGKVKLHNPPLNPPNTPEQVVEWSWQVDKDRWGGGGGGGGGVQWHLIVQDLVSPPVCRRRDISNTV